ncbi:MAG TPA: hypothetical protein VH744_08380, partial [Terriglobales bacterium]
ERRLFCHVTRALQGVVLRTVHVARDFIASTTTSSGLKVAVEIARKVYFEGRKVTQDFLDDFPVRFNKLLPELSNRSHPVLTGAGNWSSPI